MSLALMSSSAVRATCCKRLMRIRESWVIPVKLMGFNICQNRWRKQIGRALAAGEARPQVRGRNHVGTNRQIKSATGRRDGEFHRRGGEPGMPGLGKGPGRGGAGCP